jgi:hypothetical protein
MADFYGQYWDNIINAHELASCHWTLADTPQSHTVGECLWFSALESSIVFLESSLGWKRDFLSTKISKRWPFFDRVFESIVGSTDMSRENSGIEEMIHPVSDRRNKINRRALK